MSKIEIDVTPEIALAILRSLPELVPVWLAERGGMAVLHKKLGYASNRSGNQGMLQRKQKGWTLRSLVQFLEVINDTPINIKDSDS